MSYDKWNRGTQPPQRVTARVAWLRQHDLITLGPRQHDSHFAPRPWLLTEDGEAALAKETAQ
jgi:hypothetical protein